MKTILETIQMEFDKSNFLIDLVEHDNGKLYIEIIQTIHDSEKNSDSIKINPTILPEIIKVLVNYQAIINKDIKPSLKYINEIDQEKIQQRYLKGVEIKDLAIQFDKSHELINLILKNKGIEIVENKLPKTKYWFKKKNWKNK